MSMIYIHPYAGPHVGRGLGEKPAKVNSLATSSEHIVEHDERDDKGEDAGEGGVVVLPIADGRVGGRLTGHHPGGPDSSDSAIILRSYIWSIFSSQENVRLAS